MISNTLVRLFGLILAAPAEFSRIPINNTDGILFKDEGTVLFSNDKLILLVYKNSARNLSRERWHSTSNSWNNHRSVSSYLSNVKCKYISKQISNTVSWKYMKAFTDTRDFYSNTGKHERINGLGSIWKSTSRKLDCEPMTVLPKYLGMNNR